MPRPHLILTLGRSGSNTLVDMLNQNPAVLNYGEVLGEWNALRKLQRRLGLFKNNDTAYLDALLTRKSALAVINSYRSLSKWRAGKTGEIKRRTQLQTIGIKEFSLNFDRYGLQGYLAERPDIQVIGLTRANLLARMVSNARLQKTGIVSSRSQNAETQRSGLFLDPETVLPALETIESENNVLEGMLNACDPNRVLRLDYEHLYTNSEQTLATIQRVYTFLDVPEITPAIRMRKLTSTDPLGAVENRDQIAETLKGSRFEQFLSAA